MGFWNRKRRPAGLVTSGRFVGGPPQGDDLVSAVYPFAGPYRFHQGDLLTAGTNSWALDQPHDTPVLPVWGNGVMRYPFAFQPLQPPPPGVVVSVPYDALRGVIFTGIRLEELGPLYGQEVNG